MWKSTVAVADVKNSGGRAHCHGHARNLRTESVSAKSPTKFCAYELGPEINFEADPIKNWLGIESARESDQIIMSRTLRTEPASAREAPAKF